jgi:hypothetical protein
MEVAVVVVLHNRRAPVSSKTVTLYPEGRDGLIVTVRVALGSCVSTTKRSDVMPSCPS